MQSAHQSPRCHAMSKRTGCRCLAPAVRGFRVCRMHGARGGGLRGSAHGNFKHGMRTKAAVQDRREIAALIRSVKETVASTFVAMESQ